MTDLFDLVAELGRTTPDAGPECCDRQRGALMAAIHAEQAGGVAMAGARHRGAHRWRRRVLGVGHRRGAVLGVAAVVVVAIVVVVALMVVPGPGRPTSAAAAVLEQAGSAASQTTALGAGQYRYVETKSAYVVTVYGPSGARGLFTKVATATFDATGRAWTDATGPTQVRATWAKLQFSPTSAAAVSKVLGPGYLQTIENGNQRGLHPTNTPVNVAGLPTDPSQLSAVLASGQFGTAQHIANGPGAVFERAAGLLIGPTSGMTPSIASALFAVIAAQPDTHLLGSVTDHNGQRGVGVVLKGAGSTAGRRQPSEVIVDPTRGQLLEVDYAAAPPTITTTGGGTGIANLGPLWTDVVVRGVVGSSTATLPAGR